MSAENILNSFPVQPVPELIAKFYQKYADKRFVDFESLNHDPQRLNGLLDEKIHDRFIVLGQHGSGSLITLWKEANRAADELPVVWIDSGGTPINIFAKNFREFLTLLPYDTGSIYDVISKWEYHLENPSVNPGDDYDAGMLQEMLTENRSRYELLADFESWLNENNLSIAADPVKIIGEAIQAHPGIKALLKNNG